MLRWSAVALCCLAPGQVAWARSLKDSSSSASQVIFDLAPGTSVGVGANEKGFPSIDAKSPAGLAQFGQSGSSQDPGLSFQVGPQPNPITVSLGKQAGTSDAALPGQVFAANAKGASSGTQTATLDLGHTGISQSTDLEAVQLNQDGGSLALPFAKVQVPPQLLASAKQAFTSFQQAQPPQPGEAVPVRLQLAAAPDVGPPGGPNEPPQEHPESGPQGQPPSQPQAAEPPRPA